MKENSMNNWKGMTQKHTTRRQRNPTILDENMATEKA